MAKFFNQKVKKGRRRKKDKGKIKLIGIFSVTILLVLCLIIFIVLSNNHDDAVVILNDSVKLEINSSEVKKDIFFQKLENVRDKDIKIDYSNVSFETVGSYDVIIKIYGKKYSSKLEIVDTKAPDLVTKDVEINSGDSYKATDFVQSCTDNSKNDCIINFYEESASNYTKDGTYTILIVASDEAGNKTEAKEAKLVIIKKGSQETPTPVCKYGNDNYDSDKIVSVNVTKDGCALDLNLYNDENTLAPAEELKNEEITKIKSELSKVNLGVKQVYIDSNISTVLNSSGNGIVGYTLLIKVSIEKNGVMEVIEEYYMLNDKTRKYIVNKYL